MSPDTERLNFDQTARAVVLGIQNGGIPSKSLTHLAFNMGLPLGPELFLFSMALKVHLTALDIPEPDRRQAYEDYAKVEVLGVIGQNAANVARTRGIEHETGQNLLNQIRITAYNLASSLMNADLTMDEKLKAINQTKTYLSENFS